MSKSIELSNNNGLKTSILSLGGIVQYLKVPDRNGNSIDVVLGHDTEDEYLQKRDCLGATMGRVAGRLAEAQFELNGQIYHLEKNEGDLHLHGGSKGFDRRYWETELQRVNGQMFVHQTYTSSDGEQGYPGTLQAQAKFTITHENGLLIEYSATTDRKTPITLTNHSYFNLNGAGNGDIHDHTIRVFSDEITRVGPNLEPLGKTSQVGGTIDDLRDEKIIGDILPGLFKQHGSMYVTGVAGEFSKVAEVRSEKTGITMEVWTDQPYLQFYTGEHLDIPKAKNGASYPRFAGLCLECQGYPSAPLYPDFADIYLEPGDLYESKTEYRFGVF